MAEPAAPRKTRPRSPTLDAAHEVIRALGLRGGEGDPPHEDAGADFDLEEIPEPSTGSTPAEAALPAGSVPTLCPAWKRGHCTGEGLCPKQQPQPGPDDGALPEVGRAAARAALRYGVAQGWILDETARGSVNIQEAVDRVAHAGQAAVALHTRGRHGGPAEGIIVEPSGMVLVLAADMVRGVLNASRVRRARPQWTIQVYTPPRAWPFSTSGVLPVMWHVAPEDAPKGTAEDIARDLHTWPAGQDYPWRRSRGGLPVAPAAEGLSLAATLQRHPDKWIIGSAVSHRCTRAAALRGLRRSCSSRWLQSSHAKSPSRSMWWRQSSTEVPPGGSWRAMARSCASASSGTSPEQKTPVHAAPAARHEATHRALSPGGSWQAASCTASR